METNLNKQQQWKTKSLNRTMQYGNYSSEYFLDYSWICLNRTMQYGNKEQGQIFWADIRV